MKHLVETVVAFLIFQAILFGISLFIALIVYFCQRPQNCPVCFRTCRLVTGCYKNHPNEGDDQEMSLFEVESSIEDNV